MRPEPKRNGVGQPTCLALSVRQPWAWLIINGYKTIENRTWAAKFRGRFYLHAAKGMTEDEYAACRQFALRIDPSIPFPMIDLLERGGIVGTVELTGCVWESSCASPWFVGPVGFVLEQPRPLPFRRCRGELGFFAPDMESQPELL